jgi:hypothetical protein
MTGEPRESPFAWVTWISKLLAGENPCDFSVWFQAHYRGYDTMPDSGKMALWTIEHSSKLRQRAQALRTAGYTVTVEDQNAATYRTKGGLTVGYKPDLIAWSDTLGSKIVEVKTGQPRTSDTIQLLLYMMMSRVKAGELYYSRTGRTIALGEEAADKNFLRNLDETLTRILAVDPPLKVPGRNCRFCKITKGDCEERIETE